MSRPKMIDPNIDLVARHLRGDCKASEALVCRNMGMIANVVKRYHSPHHSKADLLQEGVVGLLIAAERFDHRRGVKFLTFASWWVLSRIAGAVSFGISSNKGRKAFWGLGKATRELFKLGVVNPSDEQLSERLKVSADHVRNAIAATYLTTDSLDQTLTEGLDTLHDHIADDRVVDPSEVAESISDTAAIRRALAALPKRERDIVKRRYLNHHSETLAEVGGRLGVTRERVRQLEVRALARMRKALEAEGFVA